MILAVVLATLSGVSVAAAGLFLVFSAGQLLLNYTDRKRDHWWSLPVWLSLTASVFLPGAAGSLVAAMTVADIVYGWLA